MMGNNSLPEGWVWSTLGDVAEYINGRAFKPTEWEDVGRPIIRIQNLTGSSETLNRSSKPVEEKFIVQDGDLLISWSATLGAFIYHGEEAILNQHIFKVKPNINKLFLYYLVIAFIQDLKSQVHGSGMQHITKGKFEATQIPLPPPTEQERIVTRIEEVFTQLEAGVAELQNAKAQLKRYRAAVLKSALEGELTREWRESHQGKIEPAETLLARILSERREKWEAKGGKGKYKEPVEPDFNEIGNIPDLPPSWVWVSLGQLAWSVKDGPHYSPKYAEEGVPFISGGNVRPSGVDFDKAKRITQELHEELSRRVKPEKGDILYTKGGTTGIARVNTYDIDFNVWVHVAVLKLAQSINPFYLQHALNSPFCYSQAQKYTHGVGNQDLGLTRMIKIIISLPPLKEQQRIVEMIERRLSVSDEIEKELDGALVRAERLRGSVLKSAFEGRLV